MIQADTFSHSKSMARIQYGREGRDHFFYSADVQRQWDRADASTKLAQTIGNLSGSQNNLELLKNELGEISSEESAFLNRFRDFYLDLAKLATTVPVPCGWELDGFETILDQRVVSQHTELPCRMLDIGPGSGRHMVGMFLRHGLEKASYVGVDSICLPYTMQNLAASYLTIKNLEVSFFEEVDYSFAREPFKIPDELASGSIWHIPLWCGDLLPQEKFDVIVCNYVLDELPAQDFLKVLDILDRCLAQEGVIYCRGGQERSMLSDLYLFGYGTYHQMDITKEILARGFEVKACDLVADTITRIFVRSTSATHKVSSDGYAACASDIDLVECVQADFVAKAAAECKAEDLPVLIWGDPGYEALDRYLEEHVEQLNVVGITNDHVHHRGATRFGVDEYPLGEISELGAKAVFVTANRFKLAERELREYWGPQAPPHIRSFNLPIGFGRL